MIESRGLRCGLWLWLRLNLGLEFDSD